MRITAAIPTFRRPAKFRRALESVLAQTRPADAVIVGDDDSSEEVRKIVRSYSDPKIIYVARQCTGRMTDNWNFVTHWPNDGYVALLEDDNSWRPDHLAWAERVLQRHPSAAIYHAGHQEAWDTDGNTVIYKTHFPPWHDRLVSLGGGEVDLKSIILDGLTTGSLNSSTTVVARWAYDCVPGFDSRYPMGMDTLMWTRLAAVGACVYGPYLGAIYTYHFNNVSRAEVHYRRAGRQSRGARRILLTEALQGHLSLEELAEFIRGIEGGTWAALITILADRSLPSVVRRLGRCEWSAHPDRWSCTGFLRASRYLGFSVLAHADRIDALLEYYIRLREHQASRTRIRAMDTQV